VRRSMLLWKQTAAACLGFWFLLPPDDSCMPLRIFVCLRSRSEAKSFFFLCDFLSARQTSLSIDFSARRVGQFRSPVFIPLVRLDFAVALVSRPDRPCRGLHLARPFRSNSGARSAKRCQIPQGFPSLLVPGAGPVPLRSLHRQWRFLVCSS
jgi:hypothetical protein